MRHPRTTLACLLIAALPVAAGSCSGILPTAPLSPARSIAGTWTTPFPVPMNLQTDICTGNRQNVARATWTVTWIITEQAGTSNGVDVEMHFSQSASTAVSGVCSDGYHLWVPEPSPIFMQGTISASHLQLYNSIGQAFDGNLTTNNITGTFGAWDCQIYCSGEQSDALKFILTKN